PNGMIWAGCCFAASRTVFLFAKGVRTHAVRFRRSESLRRSLMKFGFFSSKCTCMSTMRSGVPGDSDGRVLDGSKFCRLPRNRVDQLGSVAAAPAWPRNFLRDTGLLMRFLPSWG